MNLILLEETDFAAPSLATVRGGANTHIREVLRAKVGDTVRVGLLNGKIGTGRIKQATESFVDLEVELVALPPPAIELHLYLALPRPKLLPRILLTATTLGIKQITLMHCYRVEKAYWSCDQLRPAAMQRALRAGLEQARDTVLPEVRLEKRFKPFVEDRLPALLPGRKAFVAHPHAEALCPYAVREKLSLAIGPEGGFIPYELDYLVAAGFQTVRTFDRILRVDAALTTLVGRLT